MRDRNARLNEIGGIMSNGFKVSALLGGVGVVLMMASTADAAPADFCRDYATAAVRQVQIARSTPACNRGVGARWTTDYRVHFNWCAGAAPVDVEAERNARTNWIRSCRAM